MHGQANHLAPSRFPRDLDDEAVFARRQGGEPRIGSIDHQQVPPRRARGAGARNNLLVDAGVRVLDRRLTLGGRVRTIGSTQSFTTSGATTPIPGYTKVDLYASYRPIDRLTLFVNATNVGNTVYTVPAAETIGGGRGATVIGGATLTF